MLARFVGLLVLCYKFTFDIVFQEPVNYSLPFFTFIFGAQMWVVKHLVNDWLAGMWIFFWGNALLVFVSFILLLIALGLQSDRDIFIWSSG